MDLHMQTMVDTLLLDVLKRMPDFVNQVMTSMQSLSQEMHPAKKAAGPRAMVPPKRQVETKTVVHLHMNLHMQSTVDRRHVDVVRRVFGLYSSFRAILLPAAINKSQQTLHSEVFLVSQW
eukprot:TRINITY_DN10890_c0_g1_i1.p1 TRINITY_DN10890_c0_g1~~TRINITY_DN10890_c0_g1_i1.p1  ORF type:complete len:120 (+),score=8.81 TRINITY_DN10890_c0_g1_i1:243-602(+)